MAYERIIRGDTAIVNVEAYDTDGVTPILAQSVIWQVKKPDGTIDAGQTDNINATETIINYGNTTQIGLYSLQATFILPNGNRQSVIKTFEVYDPLQLDELVTTPGSSFIFQIDNDKPITDLSWTIITPAITKTVNRTPIAATEGSITTSTSGGGLLTDAYNYAIAYLDPDGYETPAGHIEAFSAASNVQNSIIFGGAITTGWQRRIYRQSHTDGKWRLLTTLTNLAQTLTDNQPDDSQLSLSTNPIILDGTALHAQIAILNTSASGTYSIQATLTDITGSRVLSKSFTTGVVNPIDAGINHAWMKLEDLFDSELGGPWLRDKTIQSFNRDKLYLLAPDALYNINAQYQPLTEYDATTFPWDLHTSLFSQALLVETIYHMIRSYTEQPNPVGSNVTWFDKRDYLTRWQSVLTKEEEKYLKWLDYFKRTLMGYGHVSTLVGGYSSTFRQPRFMRSQFPFVYRW